MKKKLIRLFFKVSPVVILLFLSQLSYAGGKISSQAPSVRNNSEEPIPLPCKEIENVKLKGEIIDEKNINFTLDFSAKFEQAGMLSIIGGEVTEVSSEIKASGGGFLWFGGGEFRINNRNGLYVVECIKPGECRVKFSFSAKVNDSEQWKEARFYLLPALTRTVEITYPTKDVELDITGALNVEKNDKAADKTIFTAVLSSEGEFSAKWRSHMEKLAADLVTSVEQNVIATVFPGTVKLDNILRYTVIQGKLKNIEIKVSPELNILSVKGENVQDWKLEEKPDGNIITVYLSREYEKDYNLYVEAEKILPDFPCKFSLPSVLPQKVLRLDGFLAFGTNGAIKLIVDDNSGLNQIDNNSFPQVIDAKTGQEYMVPKKSVFTYSFSGGNYALKSNADNIMPSYNIDLNYVVNFKDEDMLVRANCAIDIKDAPLRELQIKYDKGLTVNRVEGRHVQPDEYEFFEKDGEKWLKIHFIPDTIGKTDVFINFEKNLKDAAQADIPLIFIDNAKSVRGCLLLAAARGLSLTVADQKNLRKVPTGSAPLRESGLQYAFRFKDQNWSAKVGIVHEKANIVSEVFTISSVGEGTIYGSTSFTYHISGAPIDKILIRANPELKNLEFTGRDIVDWKKTSDDKESQTWQVNFKEKIFGDYNLLATYEILFSGTESKCRLGDINTKDAEAETGFIVLSTVRNLNVSGENLAESVIAIESSEIPEEYRTLIQNPILKSYKFLKSPHWAEVTLGVYHSQKLLDIAVDIVKLKTRIDRNGEAVTNAEYRIKNASLQFLTLALPENAALWNVKVNNEIKRISHTESKLLIPLPRNQDTDEPIAVEITYAQKTVSNGLGGSAKIKLQAPSPGIEIMHSRWLVEVPDNYDIVSSKGNMTALNNPQFSGLSGMLRRSLTWMVKGLDRGLFFPWVLVTFAGIIMAWSWGKNKFRIIVTIVAGIIIMISLFAGFAVIAGRFHIPHFQPVNTGEFTRLFSLPQDIPSLDISISDMKAFSIMKLIYAIVAVIVATAIMFRARELRRTLAKSFVNALGITFILSAGCQWLYFNALAAFFLAIFVPAFVSVLLWYYIFNKSRLKSAAGIASAAAAMFIFFAGFPLHAGGFNDIVIQEAKYTLKVVEKSVEAEGVFTISAGTTGELLLISAPGVMTSTLPENSDMELVRRGSDYFLNIKDTGKYTANLKFLLPLKDEGNDNYLFSLKIPKCVKNTVKVDATKENVDIEALNSVSFHSEIAKNLCAATASFTPGTEAFFRLHPQVRKIEKEKVAFFTNIRALAKFAQGFVEINNQIEFQAAQGEIAKFAVETPENMRVTSVQAPDLGAWRYDQDKHLLDVFLTKAHHGNFTINIVTQIANCNLPYDVTISALRVKDAGREHGTFGLSADISVQLQVNKSEGFNSINTADFSAEFADKSQAPFLQNLKKAFRYNTMPAFLDVKAVPVNPELRVYEKSEVDFEEEKIVLKSDISLEIAKAGIFSASFKIPDAFDIDKVTGKDIQHWDEITEGNIHKLLVHFEKRILGTTDVHIEMSILDKKREKQMTIPKIVTQDAEKLKGELTVNVERGTRMEVVSRKGLEIKTEGFGNSSKIQTSQSFSIVRADWELKADFETIAPWIQVETLQKAKISEGIIDSEAHFNFSIENAGVKYFKIRFPEGVETPEFCGENIAGFQKTGENIWEIELHQKVSGKYRLQINFRQPCGKEGKTVISAVVAEEIEQQKGFLAILSDDSLQIKLVDKKGEISDYDVRKIPTSFKVEYLSNAVMCFRTVGTDYAVTLDIVRHKSAEMLKAQVKKVDISSVVSPEGRVITRVFVSLNNGNENFLRMVLPEGGTVWSVTIDNQPVDAACEKQTILIPLKQGFSGRGRDQNVEIIYSLESDKKWSQKSQFYKGPSFDLPLKDVTWNLYLPPEFKYKNFTGSLDWVDRSFISIISSNLEDYDRLNWQQKNQNIQVAKSYLSKANEFANAGKKQEAVEAFQNASNLSIADQELNSDIQGQFLQMQRDQSTQTFFSRRSAQKKGKAIQINEAPSPAPEEQTAQQAEIPTNDINQIKQQLGGVEVRNLQIISDKIFQQQQAAATVPHPLHPTIPEGGVKIEFRRAVQITPKAPMEVSLKSSKAFSIRDIPGLAAGAMLILFLGIIFLISEKTGISSSLFHRRIEG